MRDLSVLTNLPRNQLRAALSCTPTMTYHPRMAVSFSRFRNDLEPIRDTVLRLLPEVETAYLFGSRARGDARSDSDLDLAILAPTPIEPLQRLQLQREMTALLDCDVDLVDLRHASSVLRLEVVKSGVRLFQRNPDCTLDFEARVLGDYADLLEATADLREDIHQRGRVHA